MIFCSRISRQVRFGSVGHRGTGGVSEEGSRKSNVLDIDMGLNLGGENEWGTLDASVRWPQKIRRHQKAQIVI